MGSIRIGAFHSKKQQQPTQSQNLKEEVCNAKCSEHRIEPTSQAEKKEMCPPEKEKKPTQDAKPEPEVNPL